MGERWDDMRIDVKGLRKLLREECSAAYFGGGMGGALIDAVDIDTADLDELIEIAERYGIDWSDFIEPEDEYEDEAEDSED